MVKQEAYRYLKLNQIYKEATQQEKGKVLKLQCSAITELGSYEPVIKAMEEHKAETFN